MFGWDPYVSKELIEKCVQLGYGEVGVDALERSWYFGFQPDLVQHETMMAHNVERGDLGNVLRVYNAMKANNVQPGDKIAKLLTTCLIQAGKFKAAKAVIVEFEENEFEISEETKQYVQVQQ
eukprot:TRINITY_DN3383_c0_g2_i4.p1 TRINITY_DN3383_c0_g2~~TRINITY_DN3383_c0_g2_i4.p1  ORF type:complete len:141 (-),score=25.64 TRINITY_DN3383_c0_g2_i4:650-1015(-)